MELNKIILITHIVFGHLGLILGTIIISLKKGNLRHIKLGRYYFYSILIMSISATYLSVMNELLFLFFISIFVFYLNFSGRAEIRRFAPWLTVTVSIVALINAVIMVLTFNVVLLVFAGISIWLVGNDIYSYIKSKKGRKLSYSFHLRQHIGKMTGSYIGAITAFLVVNVSTAGLSWIIWLGPTILLAPLIAIWSSRHTKKELRTAEEL